MKVQTGTITTQRLHNKILARKGGRENRIACGHLLLGTIMTVSGTGYEVEREHTIRRGFSTRDWMGMSAGANGSTSEYMMLGCWSNSRVRQ